VNEINLNMKKSLIIHPFLLSIFPILFLFSHNIEQLSVDIIYIPTAVLLCFTLLFWSLLSLIFKDKKKAGLLISLFLLWFFSYGHIHSLMKDLVIWGFGIGRHRYVLFVWSIFLVFGAYFIIRTRRQLHNFTIFLNIIAASLVVISLINIAAYKLKTGVAWQGVRNIETKAIDIDRIKTDRLPNIYYIILDEYAGKDTLKEIYHYDNSEFLDYLRKKGFYVADKSTANYPMTHLSLASSLNFRYLNDLTDKPENMIKDNRVFRFLKQYGYTIVAFSSESGYTDIKNADIYIGPIWTFNEFQNELVNTTPAPAVLFYKFGFPYILHRKHILYTFAHLANTCKLKKPIFVFAHIVAPHPPFVFGENGEPVRPNRKFSFNDWTFCTEGGTKEEYIENYKRQITFINKKIKAMVDEIIVNSPQSPIIILQGDHGPRSTKVIKERFLILNAYYWPNDANAHLYNEITPVNTFRIIFNHYFGTNYELLDDRNYFSSADSPDEFTDMTDKVISKESFF